jgi:hypothetical protein
MLKAVVSCSHGVACRAEASAKADAPCTEVPRAHMHRPQGGGYNSSRAHPRIVILNEVKDLIALFGTQFRQRIQCCVGEIPRSARDDIFVGSSVDLGPRWLVPGRQRDGVPPHRHLALDATIASGR